MVAAGRLRAPDGGGGMTYKAYLAGRFSRLPELVSIADELEATTLITVTSRWLRGGHEWVGTPDEAIPVERNAVFAQDDFDDIDAADLIVCFTEPARSAPARGGRHVEAGYALAKRMPMIVVGPVENIFYCLPEITRVESWSEATWMVRGLALGHLERELKGRVA